MLEFFFKVHGEISRFLGGMNKVGKLYISAILKASEDYKTLFTLNSMKRLTFTRLKQLYKTEFRPVGSNQLRQEDEANYCFESFVLTLKVNLYYQEMLIHICIV